MTSFRCELVDACDELVNELETTIEARCYIIYIQERGLTHRSYTPQYLPRKLRTSLRTDRRPDRVGVTAYTSIRNRTLELLRTCPEWAELGSYDFGDIREAHWSAT